MEENPTVQLTSVPDGAQAGSDAEVSATANSGIFDATVDSDVFVDFNIYVNGSRVAFENNIGPGLQDELVNYQLFHPFGAGEHTIRVLVEVHYFNSAGTEILEEATAEDTATIEIEPKQYTAGGDLNSAESTQPLDSSYENFVDFEIRNISSSSTGETPDEIEFQYPNPAIGVDTGGNFVSHDIIGGATVRQRIGDQPLEIDVSGVCTEDTAALLERLRNAEYATLYSNRFSENSVVVHIASISTSPMAEGGAADMKSGEFLYTFDLSCVEILDTGDV